MRAVTVNQNFKVQAWRQNNELVLHKASFLRDNSSLWAPVFTFSQFWHWEIFSCNSGQERELMYFPKAKENTEKQFILTFEKLEWGSVCHFCLINKWKVLLDEQGKMNHYTDQASSQLTVSRSLRVGSSAVVGTSVNASWWTGQTEPDGSAPGGSSVQSTCINEEPEAGRATKDTCICSACVCVCVSMNAGRPALTSCHKLLPVDSGVFLLCLYAACRCSLPPGSALVFFCACVHVCV